MVESIGGVFIYSKNPKNLARWYAQNFGIEFENEISDNGPFYCSFYYNEIKTGEKKYIAWSILHNKNRPELAEKCFVINYRVIEIEKFLEKLTASGIEVKALETYPEGKFSSCTDPEGNFIELWEDTVKHK